MEQKASMETPLFLRMKDRKKNNHEKVIRYKTTEHVQNRKHKRDEDGFFVPIAMFRPYTGDGPGDAISACATCTTCATAARLFV